MGIDEQRLRAKWISSSEGVEFAEDIRKFDQLLQELGEFPLSEERDWDELLSSSEHGLDGNPLKVTKEQVAHCIECSICTSTCPVSRENPKFSPKQMINRASMRLDDDIIKSREVWSCLGCAQCNMRCPAMIDIAEFNRSYRNAAREVGNLPVESHHGIQQSIARLQRHPIHQKRTAWAEKTGVFKEKGEFFYFVGCLPFFDVTFRYLDISPLDIARNALTLLNKIGIEPVISDNERCCGHDALCSGDEATFRELALWNMEAIRNAGAKTVLFDCPEGYSTFKYYYPRVVGDLPFEVIHLTEFFLREIPQAGLVLNPASDGKVTYQDPCRLGRWAEIYDAPRHLINLVPETQLLEMERNRENALCCGTSSWMECSNCSKSIQMERLFEAQQTGAHELITACPKCLIHLTCAESGEDIDLKIKDIYDFLSECLEGK